MKNSLLRWGARPALILGGAFVLSGLYTLIKAQIVLAGRPAPSAADDPMANFDVVLGTILGALLAISGLLIALCGWLTRRANRAVAVTGIVGCFFVSGLLVTAALYGLRSDLLTAAALAAALCLLLAGGTGIAAQSPPDSV